MKCFPSVLFINQFNQCHFRVGSEYSVAFHCLPYFFNRDKHVQLAIIVYICSEGMPSIGDFLVCSLCLFSCEYKNAEEKELMAKNMAKDRSKSQPKSTTMRRSTKSLLPQSLPLSSQPFIYPPTSYASPASPSTLMVSGVRPMYSMACEACLIVHKKLLRMERIYRMLLVEAKQSKWNRCERKQFYCRIVAKITHWWSPVAFDISTISLNRNGQLSLNFTKNKNVSHGKS